MILSNFNWLDYLFLSVFLLLIVLSLWRGLMKEIISILAWVGGLFLGITFASKLAAFFTSSSAVQATLTSAGSSVTNSASGPSSVTVGICFAVLLIGALILGSIMSYFMTIVVQISGLSLFNRFLGAVFGFIKAFIIGLAVIFFVQMTAYAEEQVWQQSKFVKAYQPAIVLLKDKFAPQLDDLKTKFNQMDSIDKPQKT